MKKFSKKILMLLMAIVVLVTPTFTGAVRQEVHKDRNYNWYIDQGNTGWASNSNCGPSSSVMVEKWFNRNTIATAAGARDRYPMQGGWWSTNTVSQYLNDQRIPNRTIVYNGEDTLTDILDNGNIAIVCVNTGFISFNNNNNSNIGRFYNYQGGHFLVVKDTLISIIDCILKFTIQTIWEKCTLMDNQKEKTDYTLQMNYHNQFLDGGEIL